MFYVYEWFIKDRNEVIYVGKGCRRRYKVTKHNKFFNDMIKRFDCDSRIIKQFTTEKEAFDYEYERITELKAIGQCVCNIYDGGCGGVVSWWTEERKRRYSEHNVMKNEQQRKRMSENNPMKNKEIASKVNQKNQRPVIINEIEYKSVIDVCKKYNVGYSTVKKWCEKGINHLKELCRYKDQEQVIFKGKRYNKSSCKPLTYKGNHYESPLDLAEELSIDKFVVYRWCKKGFDDDGNPCRYDNDTRELTFKKYCIGEANKKPIIVNGIYYPSKADAERALNIKGGGLSQYLNGKRKNKKYVCEYVNQQPSHTNTEKSSVEGSTTNG